MLNISNEVHQLEVESATHGIDLGLPVCNHVSSCYSEVVWGGRNRDDLFPIPHIILRINVLLQNLDYGLFAHACSNKDRSLEGEGLSFLCGLIEEHSC